MTTAAGLARLRSLPDAMRLPRQRTKIRGAVTRRMSEEAGR